MASACPLRSRSFDRRPPGGPIARLASSSATLINRRRPQLAANKAAANEKMAARRARARTASTIRRALAAVSTPRLTVVTEVPDRAMVIFAHPDDAEIGSGGVIARWAAAGCEVTYVLCTNGNAGTADRSLTPAELVDRRAAAQRPAADLTGG